MGVDVKTENENLIIEGNKKRFARTALDSFGDHRTAMAGAIAALFADGNCEVKNIDCVNTSFPEFFDILEYLTG